MNTGKYIIVFLTRINQQLVIHRVYKTQSKQSKQQTKKKFVIFCINSIFMYNIYHLIIMLMITWYGLGIGLRAAIMARGRRAQRSIPRPYHYKQPLTYLLIGF